MDEDTIQDSTTSNSENNSYRAVVLKAYVNGEWVPVTVKYNSGTEWVVISLKQLI